ncbi:MAG: ADP-ribosylglycohydrolase family protein [Deltaproteobacteria bacterium]|nr:ADP-ribosylglycohydrolase family protein [Deltaproteobacteria bacterium]
MKSRHKLVDRAVGCLLGMACGDALARPLAGLRSAEVTRRHGELRGFVEVPPEESEPQRAALKGMHGALTTLALAVVDSLVYGGDGPSGPDLARRITMLSFPRNHTLPWGTLRGAATGLVRAIDAHARGDDWRLAGVREPDATALLSVLPLGLLVGDDLDAVVETAVDLALVTHREPRSVAAAVGFANVVRHVTENRNASTKGMTTAALQAGERACRSLLQRHPGVVAGSPDAASAAISLALGRAESDPCPPDMDCRDAPEVALAAVISVAGTGPPVLDGLLGLCRRGGAADILAPALGALLGARDGGEHLPLGLIDGLAAHREIEQRARALIDDRPPALPPLYDIEYALAEREGRWRARRPPPPPPPKKSQLNLL